MDIKLSRRDFLLGAAAVPVAAMLPSLPPQKPLAQSPTIAYPGTCCLTRNGQPTNCVVTTNLQEGENKYVFRGMEMGEYTGYRFVGPYGEIRGENFMYPITISHPGDTITIILKLRLS